MSGIPFGPVVPLVVGVPCHCPVEYEIYVFLYGRTSSSSVRVDFNFGQESWDATYVETSDVEADDLPLH